MSHIQVLLEENSILVTSADVIVCPIDTDLNLSKYGLSYQLSQSAPALQEALLRHLPNGAPYYEPLHLPANSEQLQSRKILFIACAPYMGVYSEQRLLDAFNALLCAGQEMNAECIAFPAVGCGQLKYPFDAVVLQLLKATDLYCQRPSSSLRKVLFVTPDAVDAQAFRRNKISYDKAKSRSTHLDLKRLWKSTPDFWLRYVNENDSRSFVVTGNKKYRRHDNCLQLQFEVRPPMKKKTKGENNDAPLKKKELVKSALSGVSEELLTAYLFGAHDETETVFITTEQTDKERLREFAVNVVKAYQSFCRNSKSSQIKEVVIFMEEDVQYLFCTAVQETLYPISRPDASLLNSSLGTLLPNKEDVYRVAGQEVNFADPTNSKDLAIRGSHCIGQLEKQGLRSNNDGVLPIRSAANSIEARENEALMQQLKVEDLHNTWRHFNRCDLIEVTPDCKEYTGVESEFMLTAGAAAENVIKIERIQDPFQWRQFKACELKVMENVGSSKFPVSRRLWHGTSSSAISEMVKYSDYRFDRNHASDKALYGKGCYFATEASYAAQPQYAVRDNDGNGRVILAQVLTGCFTKGNPEMCRREAAELLFDSTVDDELDPSIFVTYHDAQAYPLYVVTFC